MIIIATCNLYQLSFYLALNAEARMQYTSVLYSETSFNFICIFIRKIFSNAHDFALNRFKRYGKVRGAKGEGRGEERRKSILISKRLSKARPLAFANSFLSTRTVLRTQSNIENGFRNKLNAEILTGMRQTFNNISGILFTKTFPTLKAIERVGPNLSNVSQFLVKR